MSHSQPQLHTRITGDASKLLTIGSHPGPVTSEPQRWVLYLVNQNHLEGLLKFRWLAPPFQSWRLRNCISSCHKFPGDTDAAGLETTFEPLSSERDPGVPRCAACVENHCLGTDFTKGGKEEVELRGSSVPLCFIRSRCAHAKSLHLCLTLCDPMDCSPLGSSVHGILQARILEWVAMPSSSGSS